MKRVACAALFFIAAGQALANEPAPGPAAPSWGVDKDKSRIEFSGEALGKPFTGAFGSYSLDIAFDPKNLDGSHLKAVIETASAKTGDGRLDKALPKEDWFDVKEFPKAVFRSDAIVAKGAGAYEAAGTLSLRGMTRDVTLPFTLAIKGDRAVADGETSLIRTDYGMGVEGFETGENVALNVKVRVHIEATRKP